MNETEHRLLNHSGVAHAVGHAGKLQTDAALEAVRFGRYDEAVRLFTAADRLGTTAAHTFIAEERARLYKDEQTLGLAPTTPDELPDGYLEIHNMLFEDFAACFAMYEQQAKTTNNHCASDGRGNLPLVDVDVAREQVEKWLTPDVLQALVAEKAIYDAREKMDYEANLKWGYGLVLGPNGDTTAGRSGEGDFAIALIPRHFNIAAGNTEQNLKALAELNASATSGQVGFGVPSDAAARSYCDQLAVAGKSGDKRHYYERTYIRDFAALPVDGCVPFMYVDRAGRLVRGSSSVQGVLAGRAAVVKKP